MRAVASFLMIVGALALCSSAEAKGRPGPITCPAPANVAAAIASTCPCTGTASPDGSVKAWRNHGKYVSCVVRYRNALRKAGCFTDDSIRRTLARCSARSTCGKAKVLCCHYDLGTCNDPMPGDTTPAGTCSNDSTVACDVSADCTRSTARLAHDADGCTTDGGVVVLGGGSVCGAEHHDHHDHDDHHDDRSLTATS